MVGHDLLVLPAVSVVITDAAGRLLLVREAGQGDRWGVLGGAVDAGESPAEAAVREAREEIGAEVRLLRLLDVLGGPDYEVTYPNGDQVAYVVAAYAAEIVRGVPVPDGEEVSELAWFAPDQLPGLPLTRLSKALLHATEH